MCRFVAEPRAVTRYGELEGFKYKTETAFDCKIFLGVPYAAPPVGKLRFEKPENPEKWNGIKEAKQYKPRCYPHCKDMLEPKKTYSEDCLYLNIMAPLKRRENDLGYPVIVFIHGGAFEFGGCDPYQHEPLCTNFVSKSIIFVTISYRVGFLGFLTMKNAEIVGNYGLWDQKKALSFVRDNIAAFGGDPSDVTVMGHSAGSASVTALSISPHCKGLFKRAIALSGSIFCEWAISNQVCKNSKKLLEQLGCTDPVEAKMKLKTTSITDLMKAVTDIGSARQTTDLTLFHPCIDGDFFPSSLNHLIGQSYNIPTIFGLHETESAIGMFSNATISVWDHYIPEAKWASFSKEDFDKFVEKVVITEEKFPERTNEIRKTVIDFYTNSVNPDDSSPIFYLTRLCGLLSDLMFNMPMYINMRLRQQKQMESYFFVTEYHRNDLRQTYPVKASYHCDEHKYLFGFDVAEEFDMNEDDETYQKLYVDSFVNFIKCGNPTSSFGSWLPINDKFPTRYFSFHPTKPAMKQSYNEEKINFWTKVLPKKYGVKLLSNTVLPGLEYIHTP